MVRVCQAVGTAIRACADNLIGAAVVGLNVKRLYALTFGIGLACVGTATNNKRLNAVDKVPNIRVLI